MAPNGKPQSVQHSRKDGTRGLFVVGKAFWWRFQKLHTCEDFIRRLGFMTLVLHSLCSAWGGMTNGGGGMGGHVGEESVGGRMCLFQGRVCVVG